MALMNYNHDDYPPDEFPEYTPPEPAPRSRFKRFFTVLAILALIFLSAAVFLFLYGSRLVANQQNIAVRMNAEHTATIMAAVNSTLAAIDQPVMPAASQIAPLENTVTESPTNTSVAATNTPIAATNTPVAATNTPVPTLTWTPELTETSIVAALQTEIATQMPELANTIEVTPTSEEVSYTEIVTLTAIPATEEPVEILAPTLTQVPTETLESDSTTAPLITDTLEPTLTPMPTETPLPTSTPVPTETVSVPEATETLLPQADVVSPTPTIDVTALPDTGFADDYGLPYFGLAAMASLLIILVVRLLRLASK